MSLQEQLKELSTLDAHVRGLSRRLDLGTKRKAFQQNKLDQLEQQLAELRDQAKRIEAHANTLEQDAKAAEERTEKLRGQMNTVKTNKEYSALLVEVNTLKAEQTKTEELVLEQMERVDEHKQRIAELEEKIAEQKKLVELADKEVDEAKSEVGEQLDQATSERDAAAGQVPDDVRLLFEKLNSDTDGEAVAGVEEQNRRRMEYTCGGCFMALPIEKVNATITKPDTITQCPYCHRILMVSDELRSGLAPSK